MIRYAVVILAGVVCDQAVKYWAANYLLRAQSLTVIPGVFDLTYAENTGAAFGMLRDARWFFIVLTAVILAAIAYAVIRRIISDPMGLWSLTFIATGAIGNLIDRVRNGYVIDLFEITLFQFAIFNVADVFVSLGGVLACVYLLFFYGKKEHADNM